MAKCNLAMDKHSMIKEIKELAGPGHIVTTFIETWLVQAGSVEVEEIMYRNILNHTREQLLSYVLGNVRGKHYIRTTSRKYEKKSNEELADTLLILISQADYTNPLFKLKNSINPTEEELRKIFFDSLDTQGTVVLNFLLGKMKTLYIPTMTLV